MHANPYALKQILSLERRYVIPTFQRDYEWTKDNQWNLLFEDLESVAARLRVAREHAVLGGNDPTQADASVSPHFLGAVVLDQLPSPAGGLDVRAVIDGQQRLTTVQLLIRGLLDALIPIDSPRIPQLRRLLSNPSDVVIHEDERHKLWPRRRDRATWALVMADDIAGTIQHSYAEARAFFGQRASEYIGTSDGNQDRASLLVDSTLDLFKLVVIDLEPNDDAQVIFEVLNGRQTPLSATDLVKNLLFLRAESRQEAGLEELYDTYWSPFDQTWWKKEIGRGHAARRHTDMLLAAWLTAVSGVDASPSRLYGQIRTYLDGIDGRARSIASVLQEISAFAQEYKVVRGVEPAAQPRVQRAYHRLEVFGVTTALPLLVWLRTVVPTHLSEADHQDAVVAVESFVIRRALIGGQTRGYGEVFSEVLRRAQAAAEEGESVLAAVRGALTANTQSRSWPTNEEVVAAFRSRRFYGADGVWRIRLFLSALDQRMRESDPRMEGAVVDYDLLTIEHILPQQWEKNWPLDGALGEAEATIARQNRMAALDRIGNLTLVTPFLNPSMSNDAWVDKRGEIAKSRLALNADVVAAAKWDETEIESRAGRLALIAVKEWPGPEAPPAVEANYELVQ